MKSDNEGIILIVVLLSITIFLFMCGMCFNHYYVFIGNLGPESSYELADVTHNKIENMNKLPKVSNSVINGMKDLYRKFEKVANKHGIEYWAWAGTLLGAIRHQGFIPWDDDMDLCTEIKNKSILMSVEFLRELELEGIKLTYSPIAMSIFRITYKNAQSILPPFIDIFFVYTEPKNGNLTVCYKFEDILSEDPGKCTMIHDKESWPRDYIYPIKKIKFEDMEINVPNKYVEFSIQEFSKEALTTPKYTHSHSYLSWLIPAVDVSNTESENIQMTMEYWNKITPLNWGKLDSVWESIIK